MSVVVAVLGVAVGHAKPPEAPDYLATKQVRVEARDQGSESGRVAEGVTNSGEAIASQSATVLRRWLTMITVRPAAIRATCGSR